MERYCRCLPKEQWPELVGPRHSLQTTHYILGQQNLMDYGKIILLDVWRQVPEQEKLNLVVTATCLRSFTSSHFLPEIACNFVLNHLTLC